jgi:hypothetical protein
MDMYTFSEIIHINADFVLITKEAYLSRGVQAGTGMNVGLPKSHVSGLLISVSPIFPAKCYRSLDHFPKWEQPQQPSPPAQVSRLTWIKT